MSWGHVRACQRIFLLSRELYVFFAPGLGTEQLVSGREALWSRVYHTAPQESLYRPIIYGILWPFWARAHTLLRILGVSSFPQVIFPSIGLRGRRSVDIEGILKEVVKK